ncbi:MAG: alpha/beta fold hydrolase [Pseudomonadales bacterium]|nr:alpha/beta fold hydrolase [Pseudomonadales bacterium]
MATIINQGAEIYYEHHFQRAELPTILLSHGYSATSQMWQGQLESLADIANVIVWDMRGHGQSDSPEDPSQYSEALTVSDMTALLDTCGVERAIVGGLSLGGYMTMAFHYAHRDRCQALTLFDTGPGYKSAEAREGWNATAEARAVDLETRGLDALGASAEVRVAQHRSAQGLAHAARGMLAQTDDRIIRSLPDIEMPVLVLVGEEDQPFLIPTDYMAGKIPHATRVVIPAAGHASNIDQPELFNAALKSFLRLIHIA